MNTNEFDYYFIWRENNDDYPLLVADSDCPPYLRRKDFIENPETMTFRIGQPIPRKPKMADFLATPKSFVISRKFYDVLNPMQIKGLQLIPAKITGKSGEIFEDYWYIHIFNNYPAIDREKSDCDWDSLGTAYSINKLVLNEEFLKTIPLEERMIFYLAENGVEQLFNQSVVDVILSANPTGLRFFNTKEWEQGMQFED